MPSKATTVKEYLASLEPERRATIEAVRAVILKNLDSQYEEGMSYGMIGYYVPHSVYPAGYHCDPKQPLPFGGLASQKSHLSLHLMCLYNPTGLLSGHVSWFREAWAKTGKKLDMGKACIRFKKVEDLALDVIGEAIRRVPAKKYIEQCESAMALTSAAKGRAKVAAKGTAKNVAAKVSKVKAAVKPGSKGAGTKARTSAAPKRATTKKKSAKA